MCTLFPEENAACLLARHSGAGVGANWMGCLAVWMATKGHSVVDKAIVSHLPVMTFVTLGLENSVANMFTVPACLFAVGSTSQVTWEIFLLKNLLPVTMGNIVGGAFFVGGLYLFISRRKEQAQTRCSGRREAARDHARPAE